MARIVAALALLFTLAAAPAALADSIVYVEGGNVYAITPDGVKTTLTSDGTAETPPADDQSTWGRNVGPYSNASADDQGRVLVSRRYRADDGQSSSPAWLWYGPDGKLLAANLVSMASCGSASGSIGPIGGRVDPTGTFVAFSYFCNYGPPSWSVDLRAAINFPDMQTTPANDPPDWSGFSAPTWLGRRLVATDGVNIFAQADNPEAPITPSWDSWFGYGDGTTKILSAAVARTGGKGVADVSRDGQPDRLAFFTYADPVPSGDLAEHCDLPVAAEAGSVSWSADGSLVAWLDAEGIKVAPSPTAQGTPGQPCNGVTARLLVPGGTSPVFTKHTFLPPAGPGPGGGGGGGAGGGGAGGGGGDGQAPAFRLLAPPSKVKARSLARGVSLTAEVGAPGSLAVKATAARRYARRLGLKGTTVATGRSAVAGAGHAKVRLRLAARARSRAKRLRGARLKITVTYTPNGGAPQRATARPKVR